MLDVAQHLTPLSSRLVDAFMPRGALTIAGQLNVAFLEVVSRAIGSPAPRVPENMLFGFLVKGVVPSLGFYRPVEEPVAREFKRSNLEHLADTCALFSLSCKHGGGAAVVGLDVGRGSERFAARSLLGASNE